AHISWRRIARAKRTTVMMQMRSVKRSGVLQCGSCPSRVPPSRTSKLSGVSRGGPEGALHRIRFQLLKWRTALANEIRGLLGEYGIVVAKGIAPLRRQLPLILEDGENQLSGFFREMLGEMAERFKLVDPTRSPVRPQGRTRFRPGRAVSASGQG